MKPQNPWDKRNQYRLKQNIVKSNPNPQFVSFMSRSIAHASNPWFKDPAIGLTWWTIGVINPFKNNVPLIPWL